MNFFNRIFKKENDKSGQMISSNGRGATGADDLAKPVVPETKQKNIITGNAFSESAAVNDSNLPEENSDAVLTPKDVADFERLPHWAVVAFAARCARRVQPIFSAAQRVSTAEELKTIDEAIALAEQAAGSGDIPEVDLTSIVDNLKKLAFKFTPPGGEIYHGRIPDKQYPSMVSIVVLSALELFKNSPDLHHASIALSCTELACGFAAGRNAPLPANILEFINRDYTHLVHLARQYGWTDDTPVAKDVFGPMWPGGLPGGWPGNSV